MAECTAWHGGMHGMAVLDGEVNDATGPSGMTDSVRARAGDRMTKMNDEVRLDKWLWAARFYKTRSLAVQAIDRGRVVVDGRAAKPARALRVGDRVTVRQADWAIEVVVQGCSTVRGPAPVARQLYEETPESQARREQARENQRLAPAPLRDPGAGRPTKRDRRRVDRLRRGDQ